MILLIGGSLGAGRWQCNLFAPPDPAFLAGLGSALGAGSGEPTAPPTPTPTPAPPPPPPAPPSTAPPPAAPPITPAPRRDEPTGRETLGPKKPPPAAPRAAIPDEVVMIAVRALQPTFAACWRRAQRVDPGLTAARIRLFLEVDAAGAVTSSRTDAEDARLSACLASVARKLAFPAPGRPAAVEIPLYF